MDKFKEHFLSSVLQPQLFSLLLVVLILVIFAIYIYSKAKQQKMNKAPSGIYAFTEQYVMGVDNLFNEVTEGKLQKPAPYIFTLFTFLIFGNLFGLTGLETPTSSYSVTLTLGLVSWIGIYVVGAVYQRLRMLKRLLNPIGLIGEISPLISLSFRLFGNMIAGSTIMSLIYYFTGWIWNHIPAIGELNLLGAIIAPVFHVYFDIFDALVQSLVFTLLTMIYWILEANTPEPKAKHKKNKIRHNKKVRQIVAQ